MGVVEWGALGAMAIFLIAYSKFMIGFADRLNKSEARANEAAKSADDAKSHVDLLEAQLVEHRVNVAREYVSVATLSAIEGKLLEAINRLGDRLDQLFKFNSQGHA